MPPTPRSRRSHRRRRILFAAFGTAAVFLAWRAGKAWGGKEKTKREKARAVKLEDITTLTLFRGKDTTSRRGKPVPQMKCVGGNACDLFAPEVMQCRQSGWDGHDVQWRCEASLDKAYRLGTTEVSCEGWSGPDDPVYVVVGSCGVEYTIHTTSESKPSSNADGNEPSPSFLSNLITFVFFAAFVYFVLRWFSKRPRAPPTSGAPFDPRPGFGGGPSGGGPPDDDDDPPPPYSPTDESAKPPETSSTTPPSTQTPPPSSAFHHSPGASTFASMADVYPSSSQSEGSAPPPPAGNGGPSFWTGLGLGYLSGDFLGSRRERQRASAYTSAAQQFPMRPAAPPPRPASSSSSWFGGGSGSGAGRTASSGSSSSWFGGGGSSSSASGASFGGRASGGSGGSTYTSAGFGGTKRR